MEKTKHIRPRGNVWYLTRKVPTRYLRVSDKSQVWFSLNTSDHAEAITKSRKLWDELLRGGNCVLQAGMMKPLFASTLRERSPPGRASAI